MIVYWVLSGTMSGPLTPEQDKVFYEAVGIFVGVIISVLGHMLVDAYPHMRVPKNCWMHLNPSLDPPMMVVNYMV